MTSPTYTAVGGVVFSLEHQPMTLERAHQIHAIHERNRDRWILREDLSRASRLGMAKIEQSLADEMAEAIRAATGSQLEAAA